jgi:hypothetical protein
MQMKAGKLRRVDTETIQTDPNAPEYKPEPIEAFHKEIRRAGLLPFPIAQFPIAG